MKLPLLGMHVSAAGGAHRAIGRGEEMGAKVIQIFGASPRSYAAAMPSAENVALLRDARAESGIEKVFLHAAYLVNLSSDKPSLRAMSRKSLAGHLRIAEAYGADGLIFHPGSYGAQLPEEGVAHTASGMRAVLEEVPGSCRLLVENTAAGGTKLGGTPESVAAILDATAMPERTGACLDTAHAFESGVVTDYADAGLLAEFLARWDRTIGFGRTYALHANDSKTVAGSLHDKHENIGDGYIGAVGIAALAKSGVFDHAAWMLEVPGIEGFGPDRENLERLRACFA